MYNRRYDVNIYSKNRCTSIYRRLLCTIYRFGGLFLIVTCPSTTLVVWDFTQYPDFNRLSNIMLMRTNSLIYLAILIQNLLQMHP